MKALQNIGFDVFEKNDDKVVLKRVLSSRKGKSRKDIEIMLPKLSIQFFEIDELEQLQEIASQLTKSMAKRRQKYSFKLKIMSFWGKTDSSSYREIVDESRSP